MKFERMERTSLRLTVATCRLTNVQEDTAHPNALMVSYVHPIPDVYPGMHHALLH